MPNLFTPWERSDVLKVMLFLARRHEFVHSAGRGVPGRMWMRIRGRLEKTLVVSDCDLFDICGQDNPYNCEVKFRAEVRLNELIHNHLEDNS